jgi:hypothetical protein
VVSSFIDILQKSIPITHCLSHPQNTSMNTMGPTSKKAKRTDNRNTNVKRLATLAIESHEDPPAAGSGIIPSEPQPSTAFTTDA